MIQPAFTRKPGAAQYKDILQLTEDDVILSYPTRLNFKWLMKEARASSPTFFLFRTQNLVEYPPSSESQYAVNFNEEVLRRSVVPYNYGADFTVLRTIQSWDCAHTTEKYSDLSACVSARVVQDTQRRKNVGIIYDCFMDRLRPSMLARTIVEKAMKDRPDIVVIEKFPQWETLHNEVMRMTALYGYAPNIWWQPINTRFGASGQSQKSARAKYVEPMFEGPDGRLLFAEGEWNEALIMQLVNFNGLHRSGYRLEKKDDGVDALSQLVMHVQGLLRQPGDATLEQEQVDQEQQIQAQIDSQYARVFGGRRGEMPQVTIIEPEEPDTNPLSSLLSKHGMWKR
jgi:phage terminase large subunit-like protein